MMHLIALCLALLLASAGTAHASPLLIPILTAIGFSATAAAFIAPLAVAAVSIGLSLLLTKKSQSVGDSGVELTIRADPLVPQSLIVGRAVLAGSRIAPPTSYGANNTNLIEFIALADHPCEVLVTAFVESQECAFTDTGTDRGSTVDDYAGKLALKFFDGSQTTADAYAVAALSSHPERPWTTDHKGLGRTFARIHSVYDSEKIGGPLTWKFVVDGIRLYDPRFDTTVGGSGSQRFADLSTHVFSRNLAVIAYNVLRGIRVKNASGQPVHFYGLQDTPTANLPLDIWFAAMNEADTLITLSGGGSEPQFWGGREISVDVEPLELVRDICKGTGGRFVENGGIYKLYLGAPGLPVFSFDDGTIPANRSDLFEPILPLTERTSYIGGSFISPEDGWIEKTPPPRIDTDRELVQRRVEASLDAVMVQSGTHMQRLMQQVLARSQRERRHTVPLPPALFGVEPGDIGEWPSVRNGYVAEDGSGKLFEVDSAEIDVNLVTVVHLLEVDPADYDWEAGDELPAAIGSLIQSRPAAKIIDGLDVIPYTHIGDTGIRTAAVRVVWTPPEDDDIDGLALQLRLQSDPTEIATLPTVERAEVAAGAARLIGGFASLTDYALRGRWKSANGWATDWSLWIPFTTTDARVGEAEIDAGLTAAVKVVTEQFAALRDDVNAKIEALTAGTVGGWALRIQEENSVIESVGQRSERAEARITTTEVATASNNSALAQFLKDLITYNDAGEAEVQVQLSAQSTSGDQLARAALLVRAGEGNTFAEGGMEIVAYYNPTLAVNRVRTAFYADELYLIDGDGNRRLISRAVIGDTAISLPIVAGTPNTVTPDLKTGVLSFYVFADADFELQFPVNAWPGASFVLVVEQDGTGGRTMDVGDGILQPAATPDGTAHVKTFFTCVVGDSDMIVAQLGLPGQTTSDSVTLFRVSPAVSGKLIWNLAIDGDFEPPVGSYTITPLGDDLQCSGDFRGPGGSTGGIGASKTDGGVGTATSLSGGAITSVVAGAGGPTVGSTTINGGVVGSGGTAGSASGGDTNTSGTAGSAASTGGTSYDIAGGPGAAAPSGGAQANTSFCGGPGVSRPGVAGNAPGGGSGGPSATGTADGSGGVVQRTGIAGGGSGARSVKAFGAGVLLKGVTYTLVVGDSGAAGTGTGNIAGGLGSYMLATQGAKGAAGSVRFYI